MQGMELHTIKVSSPQFIRDTNNCPHGGSQLILFENDAPNRTFNTYIGVDYGDLLHAEARSPSLLQPLGGPPKPQDSFELLGSYNGLVALSFDTGELILWNPVIQASNSPCQKGCYWPNVESFNLVGLCYDASDDDYIVVSASNYQSPPTSPNRCGIEPAYETVDVTLLCMKTNCYKKLPRSALGRRLLDYHRVVGTVICGVPHWVVSFDDFKKPMVQKEILHFDHKAEKFKQISRPTGRQMEENTVVGLASLDGQNQLGMVLQNLSGSSFEVWVMMEYRRAESWTCLFKIPQLHITDYVSFVDLLRVMPTGELLIQATCGRGTHFNFKKDGLWAYHLQNCSLREILPFYKLGVAITAYEPSLLSPPAKVGKKRRGWMRCSLRLP